MTAEVPVLSVVVALISGRRDHLAACLKALFSQQSPPSMEVLVPYDEAAAGVTTLASEFSQARFIPAEGLDTWTARTGASREHHDALRTLGIRHARGRVVALTEDHAVAAPDWWPCSMSTRQRARPVARSSAGPTASSTGPCITVTSGGTRTHYPRGLRPT